MIRIQPNRTAAPEIGSGGHVFVPVRSIGVAILLILLIASMAACRGGNGSNAPKTLAPPADNSGVRIAITKAARQGNQLWLTFRISSANPATPNMWLVGGGDFKGLFMPLPRDVRYIGLRFNEQNQVGNQLVAEATKPAGGIPSKPPYPTPFVRAYDDRESLVITGKPGAKLGVTIRKLRIDKGNSALGRIITGDWAFSFVLPNDLPTPTPLPTAPVK